MYKLIKNIFSKRNRDISNTIYSATDIAHIFVIKGIDEGVSVNQIRLQKLVYFANGVMLAHTNGERPLVREDFFAWDFGPVIPDIYTMYKQFGAGEILPDYDFMKLVYMGYNFDKKVKLSDIAQKVVDETWESLKDVDIHSIYEWLMKPGTAWEKVYRGESFKNVKLNNKDIISDFKSILTNK